jgi:V/A-type H+-transporting ATPase subunit D
MAIKVNPNRMELLRLRRRTQIAKRGHKLLKDKLDELMKKFLELIYKNRALREEVESKLTQAYLLFAIARSEAPIEFIEEALLYPHALVTVDIERINLMGVHVAELKIKQEGTFDCYGLSTTPSVLDEALAMFSQALPSMMELAQVEKAVELLASEIEKTRRRVNALEYVLIPQLEEAVSTVSMKLDEMERSYRTQLMKIKEMVSEGII